MESVSRLIYDFFTLFFKLNAIVSHEKNSYETNYDTENIFVVFSPNPMRIL